MTQGQRSITLPYPARVWPEIYLDDEATAMAQTPFTILIASGSADSTALSKSHLRHARSLSIQAPATLDALTFTVQVSYDGTTWSNLQSGGADVVVTAGDTTVITDVAFRNLRVQASGNVAADRSFVVTVQE